MSCFQKNVYSYLNSALDIQDVNITQRLKFYRNKVQYDAEQEEATNEARSGKSLGNFPLSTNANTYTSIYKHMLVCTVKRVY